MCKNRPHAWTSLFVCCLLLIRSAKAHRSWLTSQMASHSLQKVIVDCSFDHLMKLEEVCSLAKQIKYMYGHNIRSTKPLHLMLTSLHMPPDGFQAADVWKTGAAAAPAATESSATNMTDTADAAASSAAAAPSTSTSVVPAAASAAASSSSSTSVLAPSTAASSSAVPAAEMYTRALLSRLDGFDRLAFDRFESHFLALPASAGVARSQLVYLTAESPTVLTRLDPAKVYVIGGIVDHNRMKGLCHALAAKHQLATARLPIQENLVNLRRTVITVNQGQISGHARS